MRVLIWIALLLGSIPVLAAAQPAVVRVGTHDGFGRIVFEFPQAPAFTTERTGSTIVLHFPGGGDVPSPDAGAARNVTSVTGGSDMATVVMAPGARLRVARLGSRVVVDVLDPASTRPVASQRSKSRVTAPVAEAKPGPAEAVTKDTAGPVTPIAPLPTPSGSPAAAPAASVMAVAPAEPAEPAPPPAAPASTETLAIAAAPATPSEGAAGNAVVLPFGPAVAAAAFRHGGEAWVVFDERRPLDLASLAENPVFSSATIELLPAATLLRLAAPTTGDLRLEQHAGGWSIVAGNGAARGPVSMPVNRDARVLFSTVSPGQVVAVPDAETGRNLLVGTLKSAGPGVPVAIRVPEFAIQPSWQGLVVEPVSDRMTVRAVPDGFAIETGAVLSPLPENAKALASAAVLTRRFDFPAEPVAALLRRLQSQVQEVGHSPAQSRLEPRKAVAQTMLALGLAAEAQSLLQLAISEDPRGAADPEVSGLSAIAALVSGRPQEAAGLDAPGLSGTDEIALWRAVRAAMSKENAAEAGPVFAATVGLVSSYPDALRNRLLPIAAESMASGGSAAAVDELLASLPDEPLLAFARAIRLEQKGETASAITLYDALAHSRDRLTSARAATRATLLRLSSGAISPAEAAGLLERGFEAWRGDARERDLRLRTAEVQAKAGQWRKAIDTLKETAQLFPSEAPGIAARITKVIGDLLHGPGTANIAPLDLVSLADENASVVAQSDLASMAVLLADKLSALDLPKRAGPVIQRMAAAAPPGAGRAALGARLAALQLGEGDVDTAAAALATTDAPGLPPSLQEERGLLDARIHASRHDIAGATSILSAIATPAADDLRATILGDSGDWHGAALALEAVAVRQVPQTGPLDPAQQDVLLRLASAESRAGDDSALHSLGAKQSTRMSGARGDMFRLLTTAPVSGVADLRRAAGDIALARALPTALNTLHSR